jgi:predicted O-methyltransferase YrrM
MTAPEQVLHDIEAEAKEKGWPIIGPERGALLVDVIRRYKPKRILELGALVGYSSVLMAVNLPEDGQVVSIEIDPARVEESRATQRRAGLDDRCVVVQGDASEMIPRLEGPWDMMFIDAVKQDYLHYLKEAEPALSPDAVIVADNVKRAAEAVAPYLDYVRNSGRYSSSYHEFGNDAVEVSVLLPSTDGGFDRQ